MFPLCTFSKINLISYYSCPITYFKSSLHLHRYCRLSLSFPAPAEENPIHSMMLPSPCFIVDMTRPVRGCETRMEFHLSAAVTWQSQRRLFRAKRVHEWPSQSLDVYPVGTLSKVSLRTFSDTLLWFWFSLNLFCKEQWTKISVSRCAELVNRYLKRTAAVIATKGSLTRYSLRRAED